MVIIISSTDTSGGHQVKEEEVADFLLSSLQSTFSRRARSPFGRVAARTHARAAGESSRVFSRIALLAGNLENLYVDLGA